jgi:hypothetical protein
MPPKKASDTVGLVCAEGIKENGEKTMVDIFTLLLAILSICALAAVATKIMLTPPKIWDEVDWIPFEIKDESDYEEIEENKPHIWID